MGDLRYRRGTKEAPFSVFARVAGFSFKEVGGVGWIKKLSPKAGGTAAWADPIF